MIEHKDIPRLTLKNEDNLKNFAIRRMEDIHESNKHTDQIPHRHAYYTVLWCLQGKGTHDIDFQSYPIEDNTIFFVSPDQVHHVETEDTPSGFVFLFTPLFLEKSNIGSHFISDLNLFRECGISPPLKVSPEMMKELQGYVEGMKGAYASNSQFKLDSIGSFLKLFLIRCNEMQDANAEGAIIDDSHRAHLIRTFKQLIETNYKREHSVQFYADQLHISSSYLNEVIKTSIGLSAKQYIIDRIILEAKREALFTDLSSKEVGYDLGFKDASSFSKFFKKYVGEGFSEFRKSVHHAA